MARWETTNLIDLTKGIRKPHHQVRLTKDTKYDINVWHDFLCSYNGKSFFLSSQWETSKSLNLFTDAAGSLGYATIFGNHGSQYYGLRIFPIVLAIEIWGSIIRDRYVVFFSDNQAVVEIINRQTSKDRSVMVLLRHFVLCTLEHNILFHAKHIAGSLNRESDALSRLQVEKFRFLAPYADEQPTTVPAHLQPNNWHFTWPCFFPQPLLKVLVRDTRERAGCMSTLQWILASLVALSFEFQLAVWRCSFLIPWQESLHPPQSWHMSLL